MRTASLLLACALKASFLVAQTPVESADQRSHVTRYTRVAWAGQDRWAFCGVAESHAHTSSFLVVRTAGGATLLDRLVSASGITVDGSVLLALPDGFLLAGQLLECDLPTGNEGGIVRVDIAGSPSWHVLTPTMRPSDGSVSPSGRLAFGDAPTAAAPQLLLLAPDGTGPVEQTSPWPVMRAVRWLSDDTLLVLHDARLACFAPNGAPIGDRALPPGALDLAVQGVNDLRVLYEDRLVRYDAMLVPQDSVAFGAHAPARSMEHADGALWVMAAAHFLRIDPASGAVTAIADEPLDGLTVHGMAVAGGLVMTAGTAEIRGRTAGVMRSCDTSGMFARHGIDVSLSMVSLDSVEHEVRGRDQELVFIKCQPNLRLRNTGTVRVDEVLINTQDYFFAICGVPGRSFPLSGLSLAPGDSMDIALPSIQSDIFYCPRGSTVQWPLCFVAISPNLLVDRVPTGNEACQEIVWTNTTGMGEGPVLGNLLCHPNPFTSRTVLRFGAPLPGGGELVLFDVRGAVAYRARLSAGTGEWPLDLAGLAPGSYTAHVTSAGGRAAIRVVKMP